MGADVTGRRALLVLLLAAPLFALPQPAPSAAPPTTTTKYGKLPAPKPATAASKAPPGSKGAPTRAAMKTAASPPPTASSSTAPLLGASDIENEETQRLLGSSVVTSVSVITDQANGTRTYLSDAAGRPMKKPLAATPIGSPAGMLAPDRYEFYTFDETGDLVRRHMTLDEIKSLLAGGDGELGETPIATFYHGPIAAFNDPLPVAKPARDPEDLDDAVKGVQDVVNNVQNVLKSQLAATKNKLPAYIPAPKPPPHTPTPSEAAATWSMILPGIMDSSLPTLQTKSKPVPSTTPNPPPSTTRTKPPTYTKKPVPTSTPKKPVTKPKPASTTPQRTSTRPRRPVISTTHAPVSSLAPSSKIPPSKPSPTTNLLLTSSDDVVGSVYTLVSSSPDQGALKHTAINNASNPNESTTTRVPPPVHRPVQSVHTTHKTTVAPNRHTTSTQHLKNPSTRPISHQTSRPTSHPTSHPTSRPQKPTPALEEIIVKHTETPLQAESMVKVVTIQKPIGTSTSPDPEPLLTTTTTTKQTTPERTSALPESTTLTAQTAAQSVTTGATEGNTAPKAPPTTPQPFTTKFRHPPTTFYYSSSYEPSRAPTPTTDAPTTTPYPFVEDKEAAASDELDTTVTDNDLDSRTTVDDAALIDKELVPTTLPTTVIVKGTPTAVPPTRPSAPVKTNRPQTTTEMSFVTFTLDLNEKEIPTTTPRQDFEVETATEPERYVTPIRYTEFLTKVPASALITKYNTPKVEQTTKVSTNKEQTTRFEYTVLPNESTTEAVTFKVSSEAASAETTVEYEEDDDATDLTLETEPTTIPPTEATTKLYLKISSSESKHAPTSTLALALESVEADTTTMAMPTTDTDDAEEMQYTAAANEREAITILSQSTEPTTQAYRTPAPTEAATTSSSSSSLATSPADQSPASTEQRTTVSVPDITTQAMGSTEDEPESRTESLLDLDSAELTGNQGLLVEPASTKQAQDSAITPTADFLSTSTAATTSGSNELKEESSNVEATKVRNPAPEQTASKKVPPPAAPVSKDQDNKINKMDKVATSAHEPADVKLKEGDLRWTRVPVVGQASQSTTESTRAPAVSTTSSTPEPEPSVKHDFRPTLHHAPAAVELEAAPRESLGLEASTVNVDPDVRSFVSLCNDLAFQMWVSVKDKTANGASRSVVVSPFAATSTLAMVFLGARGPTSGQMNDVLRLDDMVSFNPHQVMANVTESLVRAKNPGVATAALVRELYSDKSKGKLLDFYKERAQQFYDGHVEEISFRQSGELVRRKTNLLVKRQTRGRVQEYMRGSSLALRPPLAAFGANIFETDCTGASTDGRDGEMHFVVVPSNRQRRLVPVPAAVWRSGFLAGYDPALDATAVAMGSADAVISTVLVLPGQQGHVAPGDSLSRLEQRLLESRAPSSRWSRLLRSLLPRPGLELQLPRFSHRSVLNMSAALQRMGLDELFSSEHADLRGLNGVANDLHLSDVVQLNTFSTCGERAVDSRHHVEFYPTSPLATPGRRSARRLRARVAEGEDPRIVLHPDNIGKDRESFYARVGDALEAAEARGATGLTSSEEAAVAEGALDSREVQSPAQVPVGRTFQRIADFEDPDLMKVPLALRPRQARVPEAARLRFDRPFLFFVRHNPTGVLLHMGRFNPRLLP